MAQIKKYIIAENFTILFDPVLRHEDIARNLPYNVTGAGYVTIGPGVANKFFQVKCWSKMNEPKLICNPVKDKKAIERFLEINEVEVPVG